MSKYALAGAGICSLVLLQQLSPDPANIRAWWAWENALHFPMFSIVTALLWFAFSRLQLTRRCAVSAGASTGIAIGSEWLQQWSAGTPSVIDLGMDVLAIVLTVAWLASNRPSTRRGLAAVGLVVLLIVFFTPLKWLAAYYHLRQVHPVLADYQSVLGRQFTRCGCEMTVVGDRLRLDFAASTWLGFLLVDLSWQTQGYRAIRLKITSETTRVGAVDVRLRRRDVTDPVVSTQITRLAAATYVDVPLKKFAPYLDGAKFVDVILEFDLVDDQQKRTPTAPRTILISQLELVR